jgi:hypothetical protein
VVAVLLLVATALTLPCRAATLTVRTELAPGSPAVIQPGQSTTVIVSASVEQPSSPEGGIFTFDLDLLVANLIAGQPSPLAIMTIHRPDAEDALLGGGDGRATAEGRLAVHGGYLETGRGIAAPQTLFTAEIRALDQGQASLIAGPSVDPYGVDFVLYDALRPTVVYDRGVTITVIPEPSALAAGLIATLLTLRPLRKRSSALNCGVVPT